MPILANTNAKVDCQSQLIAGDKVKDSEASTKTVRAK